MNLQFSAVQLRPMASHGSEHFIRVRVVYKPCDHLSPVSRSNGDTAVIVSENIVCGPVDRIYEKAESVPPVPVISRHILFTKEGAAREEPVKFLHQLFLDGDILIRDKVCQPRLPVHFSVVRRVFFHVLPGIPDDFCYSAPQFCELCDDFFQMSFLLPSVRAFSPALAGSSPLC